MEGKDAPRHVTAEHGPGQHIHLAAGDDTHAAQLIQENDEDSISRVPADARSSRQFRRRSNPGCVRRLHQTRV